MMLFSRYRSSDRSASSRVQVLPPRPPPVISAAPPPPRRAVPPHVSAPNPPAGPPPLPSGARSSNDEKYSPSVSSSAKPGGQEEDVLEDPFRTDGWHDEIPLGFSGPLFLFPSRPVLLPDEMKGALLLPSEGDDESSFDSSSGTGQHSGGLGGCWLQGLAGTTSESWNRYVSAEQGKLSSPNRTSESWGKYISETDPNAVRQYSRGSSRGGSRGEKRFSHSDAYGRGEKRFSSKTSKDFDHIGLAGMTVHRESASREGGLGTAVRCVTRGSQCTEWSFGDPDVHELLELTSEAAAPSSRGSKGCIAADDNLGLGPFSAGLMLELAEDRDAKGGANLGTSQVNDTHGPGTRPESRARGASRPGTRGSIGTEWSLGDPDIGELLQQAGARLVTVTFKPGKIGILPEVNTGHIQKVAENSQAEHSGIKVGMRIRSIDSEEFSLQLLKAKVSGVRNFTMVFEEEAAEDDLPFSAAGSPLTKPSVVKADSRRVVGRAR